MTLYAIVDIIYSMSLLGNPAPGMENTAFIYTGLGSISGEGREYLKSIAERLIAIQSRPGAPVPESVCRGIMRETANESLQGYDV